MDQSYTDLKEITDIVYEILAQGQQKAFAEDVINLMDGYGIGLRQRDGILSQVNISIPTSVSDAIVVGLRYVKNDGTKTEDLFLFQQNSPIVVGYRGRLERRLWEYTGTHKLDR